MEIIALVVSILAFVMSVITTWLTIFYSGKLKISHPSVIFFGPDAGYGPPKIFLRAILYSTSRRGQIIESMHAKLRRSGTTQIFNIWVYGETNDLKRGSGLYVSKEGVVYNHHFALPKENAKFEWQEGEYVIELYSKVVTENKPSLILSQRLNLPEKYATQLQETNSGLYFDWEPESQVYSLHIDTKYVKDKV